MNDKRLDRLYPALSAKERAILILKAQKAGKPQDAALTASTPSQQHAEVNRLIGLMNAVNVELALSILLLQSSIHQTELKCAWLASLRTAAIEFEALASYIVREGKEPITASALGVRADELGAELASLDELADALVEEYDGWKKGDRDEHGQPNDVAWERVWKAERARMVSAVASGALPARGKGKRARVTWGDFARWSGQEQRVFPEWGYEYEVYADAEARRVEAKLRERRFVEGVIRKRPDVLRCRPGEEPVFAWERNPQSDKPSLVDALLETVPSEVRNRWSELRAIDIVVAEVAEEFEGEDPLDETSRRMLDQAGDDLRVVAEGLAEFGMKVEPGEPAEEDVALVRGLLRRASER
jgi:hypothetical protein